MYKSVFDSYENKSKKGYVEFYHNVKSELENELIRDVDIHGFDAEGEVE